jgi:hypothetical protein
VIDHKAGGITTSEGRRHDVFEKIMRTAPLDFVQFTYNVVDREAEDRLLPLAADRGMAVIVNRPFQQGTLTRRLDGEPLPAWAAEIGASNWAQFILTFILSHPAVTVAIPATTSPAEALTKLNSTLNERIVRGMFVTTIVGRVIPSANRIELASAGHCKPLLIRAEGSVHEIETQGSVPMGILPKVTYRQGKLEVHPGDWLVCFTDGLSESRNPSNETFFEQKIIPSLSGRKFASPQNIVDHLIDCERRHRGTGRQSDDLTILAGGLT